MGIIIFFLKGTRLWKLNWMSKSHMKWIMKWIPAKIWLIFFFKDQFSIPNITTELVQISSSVSFLNFPVIIRTFCFYIFLIFILSIGVKGIKVLRRSVFRLTDDNKLPQISKLPGARYVLPCVIPVLILSVLIGVEALLQPISLQDLINNGPCSLIRDAGMVIVVLFGVDSEVVIWPPWRPWMLYLYSLEVRRWRGTS